MLMMILALRVSSPPAQWLILQRSSAFVLKYLRPEVGSTFFRPAYVTQID